MMILYGPSNVELAGIISSLAIFKLSNLNLIDNFKMVWDSSLYPRKYYFKESNEK
ncbi:hypothetical protein [Malaciobacter mytili]|uniref:hypothetical protein n=1 Tax=Malaciobacter mytili TaxID=603050 RepID=UPI0013C49680|nr:hypothetical protein [Malaciobacter mytili]